MAKKKFLKIIDWIATIFITIGGLNWGLVAFNFNLVEAIPVISMIPKIIYGVVGVSTIYILIRAGLRKFMK